MEKNLQWCIRRYIMHLWDGTNSCPIYKTTQSFFWPLPFSNASKENTNHLNFCGKKDYILMSGGHLYTHRTRQISHWERTKLQGCTDKILKLLSNFFVFCLSRQKTTLWFSERLRKWGIWCLLHLIFTFTFNIQVFSTFFPLGHIVLCETSITFSPQS